MLKEIVQCKDIFVYLINNFSEVNFDATAVLKVRVACGVVDKLG
jgi:hypothetical protein